MSAPPSSHPPLARAYLALADDPEPPAIQRTLPRVVVALLATVVLGVATPQAWASTVRGEPRDAPAATAVKAGHDDDGDDDWDDGDPWAATNA
jgi:hypothetical protein